MSAATLLTAQVRQIAALCIWVTVRSREAVAKLALVRAAPGLIAAWGDLDRNGRGE